MAVSRMRFIGSGAGTVFIDLAKSLSLQERRLHRQKKLYTVYGGYFVDTPADGNVSRVNLNTAPNTWVARTAVNRAFRIWKKMVKHTIDNSDGAKPGKYNDFKIYLNNSHGAAPELPVDAEGNELFTGSPEWDYSTLTSGDPAEDAAGVAMAVDQFELNLVGHSNPTGVDPGNAGGWTRVGVIDSWLNSRPVPSDAQPENIPSNSPRTPDPLANLFDTGDELDDRVTIMESEGDQPPYDEDSMFGMVSSNLTASHNLQRQSVVTTTPEMPVGPVHGFQALCGLIQVEVTAANGAWELVLDVETVGENF